MKDNMSQEVGKDIRGIILGGRYGEVLARQKSNSPFEMGELLVAKDKKTKTKVICQVFDLLFGSQVSQQNRELISGMSLEEDTEFEFMDEHLRQYTLAHLKEMLTVYETPTGSKVKLAKSLPGFFCELHDVTSDDFSFLTKPKRPLFVGDLRSGSKVLDVPISLDGKEVLSHHVLIPATTGRGKSNLLKVLLWSIVEQDYCGMLVLDPHDEYYRPEKSLRAHPNKDRIIYYSTDPLPMARSLLFNIEQLKPKHFDGSANWSSAQKEALSAYYKQYGIRWVQAIVLGEKLGYQYNEATLGVIQRRISSMLDLEQVGEGDEKHVESHGPFSLSGGKTIINDVLDALDLGKTVVVDTSGFSGSVEILIGSIFSTEALSRNKRAKQEGTLKNKPVISIVLEESPRVLGKEVLEQGPNIFSTIAREGRKFNIGLLAITQLPSLIPRQVLANMNTKIVLGIEMKPERQAIIESAAQDLSSDDRAIASLDKGEAIVTTNFSPFAIPVKIPFFDEWIDEKIKAAKKDQGVKSYTGLKE